jgi:hypothetical protein
VLDSWLDSSSTFGLSHQLCRRNGLVGRLIELRQLALYETTVESKSAKRFTEYLTTPVFLAPSSPLVGLRSLSWTVGLLFFDCFDEFSFMVMVCSTVVLAASNDAKLCCRAQRPPWV